MTGGAPSLTCKNLCLIDSFTFRGATTTPAVIDAFVEWEETGPAKAHGSGDAVPPTDPAAFKGRLRFAKAKGRCFGTELGFEFKAQGTSGRGLRRAPLRAKRGFLR